MTILMLAGVEARVLGRAPIPTEPELRNERWVGRPLLDDDSPLPALAWKPYVNLVAAEVPILGVWIFHELSASQPDRLATLRGQLPKVDTTGVRQKWQGLREHVAGIDWSAVGRKVQGTVQGLRTAATPVIRSAAQRTSQAVVKAAPVVWDVTKKTAKVAVKVGAVAVPIVMGTLILSAQALAAVAAVDPELVIIIPADDGGDPVWISIACWFEEA